MSAMNFDTSDLRIFVAAAEHGSLTAASLHCHLALAAISKRIAKLEEQTGSRLFLRSKSGVELTPAGEVFLRHARNWLYDFQMLNAELQEHGRGFRGLIRLAANTNAMLGFIPECVGQYLNRHRQIDIQIEEVLSLEVIRRVAEGRADVGIFAASVDAGHLELFPFRDDLLVVVMDHEHRLAKASSLHFSQVIDEDFIALDKQAAIQTFLNEKAQRLGKTMHIRVETRSFDAICRFAQSGFGIGIIPLSTAELYGNNTTLAVVPLADEWAERRLKIAVRSLAALPIYARQLVEHLTDSSLSAAHAQASAAP
jgi:DNA-binding transcriptional LysR family regulator